MKFAKRQLFFISIILSLSLFCLPFTQELYAESLLSKIKTKASEFISNTVEKYTSRDFWVDKASSTICSKVISKPVKLATAALGMAIGTAVGGPVGATLGAYVGNKIGTHLCDIVAKPIVKGVINEKLDNSGETTISTIFKVCKSMDGPSLACDTTGAVVGDILGSAIGGILGAAITASVGGGTILPIIGTITFATLGSKYGTKFGTWLGKKIGEKFFNKSYKALTGKDRTSDQSADNSILLSTAQDIVSLDKEKLARNTTGEVVGDVIGSVLGTVAGATVSAFTTGGTSDTITNIGTNLGSKIGKSIGNWIGTKFFDKSKEVISNTNAAKSAKVKSSENATTAKVKNEYSNTTSTSNNFSNTEITKSDLNAVYQAYLISYSNYSKALADKNTTKEDLQKYKEVYNTNFNMYNDCVKEYYNNK